MYNYFVKFVSVRPDGFVDDHQFGFKKSHSIGFLNCIIMLSSVVMCFVVLLTSPTYLIVLIIGFCFANYLLVATLNYN